MLRVGLLTSGGDCQALNATMRGVAKGLYELFDEVEIYGFLNGFRCLIQRLTRFLIMKARREHHPTGLFPTSRSDTYE